MIGTGPREVNTDNVQHWCRHTKELKKSHISKALKFLRFDCIKYYGKAMMLDHRLKNIKEKYPDAKHLFVCLPLNTKDHHTFFGITENKEPYEAYYNNSEYFIHKRKDGTFSCNCQGFQTKEKRGEIIVGGANCSHVLSLYYCFKIKRFGRIQGSTEDLEAIDEHEV